MTMMVSYLAPDNRVVECLTTRAWQREIGIHADHFAREDERWTFPSVTFFAVFLWALSARWRRKTSLGTAWDESKSPHLHPTLDLNEKNSTLNLIHVFETRNSLSLHIFHKIYYEAVFVNNWVRAIVLSEKSSNRNVLLSNTFTKHVVFACISVNQRSSTKKVYSTEEEMCPRGPKRKQ